ncbi:MAG: M20/M25/M40 family metallo-hydrolase [Deltaproteobacteria bacterium]|nr:M20/M25/M40 family metallo-hydrolase [Deltaproteobacteria bacterium]
MRTLILLGAVACGTSHRAPAPRPPDREPIAAPRDPMTEASLRADLQWLAAPERAGRGSRSDDAAATAAWIEAQLRAAGYAPTRQPIEALPGQVNVVAARGTGPATLVMAHYDHLGPGFPGADDNASGVAAALAVARDLAHRPATGRVVFLFTGGEEVGLLGARAYAAAPTIPLPELRAVYNLDMVGRPFFGAAGDDDRELGGVGLPEHPDLADLAHDAAADAGLRLLVLRAGALTAVGQSGRSDDWVFRERGVPAVHFSTGLGDDYHRATDTLDKVSPTKLLRVARFVRGLVERTASAR